LPCVLENNKFAQSCEHFTPQWLAEHMGPVSFKVHGSKINRFIYSDESKNLARYKFEPPITAHQLSFAQFFELEHEKDQQNLAQGYPLDSLTGERLYNTPDIDCSGKNMITPAYFDHTSDTSWIQRTIRQKMNRFAFCTCKRQSLLE
jgi:hypothetical protein